MTHERENIEKIAEFNALFSALNDKGQQAALILLESLDFAQSVISLQDNPVNYKNTS